MMHEFNTNRISLRWANKMTFNNQSIYVNFKTLDKNTNTLFMYVYGIFPFVKYHNTGNIANLSSVGTKSLIYRVIIKQILMILPS